MFELRDADAGGERVLAEQLAGFEREMPENRLQLLLVLDDRAGRQLQSEEFRE